MTRFLLPILDTTKCLIELMKLSITSPEFYRKVLSQFKGLGLRYIFTLCFLGTVISSSIIIAKLSPVVNYFHTRQVTNKITALIDVVINNWQTISYDGMKITSEEDPIMLGGAGKPIIAIDAEDKLSGSIKKTIPIVFGKTKLFFNINQSKEASDKYQLQYDYSSLFGPSKKLVDSEELVSLVKNYIEYFDKVFIFVIMPLLVILNFATLIFEKILMVIIVYFALKTLVNNKITMKSAIRIVAFSCGVSAFLLPISIVFPPLVMIVNGVQLWTSFLIIYALIPSPRLN